MLWDDKLGNCVPAMRSCFQALYHGLGHLGQTVIFYEAEYSNILSGSLSLKATMENIEALWQIQIG